MPSLLDKAQRRFIRGSEVGHCRLRIANAMIGTEERRRRFSDVSMRMGTHLEPMVNEFLADQGLSIYFAGDRQLELVSQDPPRVGHADGLIGLEDEPTWWLTHNLPEKAMAILISGQPLMSEVKTMNARSFGEFREGGLRAGTFIKMYLPQISGYNGIMLNPADDEAWMMPPDSEWVGSDEYKALLGAKDWDRPVGTLVTVFCPDEREFAFEYLPFDQAAYDERNRELQTGVIDLMEAGVMPAPDHDGQAGECYFCPYAYVCPAVQAIMETRTLDTVPMDVQGESERLDEISAEYVELSAEIKALEKRKKVLRDRMIDTIGNVGRSVIVTGNHIIKLAPVAGRRTIDQDALALMLGGKDNIPRKTGAGHSRLYIDALFGPSVEND